MLSIPCYVKKTKSLTRPKKEAVFHLLGLFTYRYGRGDSELNVWYASTQDAEKGFRFVNKKMCSRVYSFPSVQSSVT